jgi:hypothetical protein
VPFIGTNLEFQGHRAPTKLADKKRVANTTEGCISIGVTGQEERTIQFQIIKPFIFLEDRKGGLQEPKLFSPVVLLSKRLSLVTINLKLVVNLLLYFAK